MSDDDYADRLARGEPRAVLHAYGHPGAYERVTAERDAAMGMMSGVVEGTASEIDRLRADGERLQGLLWEWLGRDEEGDYYPTLNERTHAALLEWAKGQR